MVAKYLKSLFHFSFKPLIIIGNILLLAHSQKPKQNSEPMNQAQLSQLTDDELQEELKKIKPSPIIDAFFIGFLIGIIIFSVAAGSWWGVGTLIPLFLIYLFLKKSKKYDALKKEIKDRNLQ
jgi:hypothetical protein